MAPAIIPTLAREARGLISSTVTHREPPRGGAPSAQSASAAGSSLGPLAIRSILFGRDDGDDAKQTPDPTKGALDPHDINNVFVFIVFGLIGVAFVVGGIWFFFWAKNGGIYFQKDDWEDYKSTVMRRKGPNGTVLSGATESTRLGGGSVYKDVADHDTEIDTATRAHSHDGGYTAYDDDDDDRGTQLTESTGLTGITGGVSDFYGREKRRKKREQKEREKERRREEKSAEKSRKRRDKERGRRVGPDGVLVDERAEAEAREQLRSYRDERPARVGGLNVESESSVWDGSTNPSHSNLGANSEVDGSAVTSELMSHQDDSRAPPPDPPSSSKKNAGGIRKVYSVADRRANREEERLRTEARRVRESNAGKRSSSRRGYNYQRADNEKHTRGSGSGGRGAGGLRQIDEQPGIEEEGSEAPGRYDQSAVSGETGSEVGTKSYAHPIPGLSSVSGSGAGSQVGGGSTVASDFAYQDEKRKKRASGAQRRSRG